MAEINKYLKKAEAARDTADLIQSFATMYKTMAKHGLKATIKGFKKLFTKKGNKAAVKSMTAAQKKLAKVSALKAQKEFGKQMLVDQYDGLYSILVDVSAKETEASSKLGKALRFADDATSVAHYLWIASRAVKGGGLSWSSLQEDAGKKIKELVKNAIGYKREMREAINIHNDIIMTLEVQHSNVVEQIATVEAQSADLVVVLKT